MSRAQEVCEGVLSRQGLDAQEERALQGLRQDADVVVGKIGGMGSVVVAVGARVGEHARWRLRRGHR
jgi:hypothetical protein